MTNVVSLTLLAFALAILTLGVYRIVEPAHSQQNFNQATPDECVASAEDREQIRRMSLESFDEAFKLTAHNLYLNWLKEYGKSPEPERALKGMINNRHAWIKTRAYGRAYNPAICGETK
jgi:hypothetical protein